MVKNASTKKANADLEYNADKTIADLVTAILDKNLLIARHSFNFSKPFEQQIFTDDSDRVPTLRAWPKAGRASLARLLSILLLVVMLCLGSVAAQAPAAAPASIPNPGPAVIPTRQTPTAVPSPVPSSASSTASPSVISCLGPISEGEYQALYSLYNSTNGTHWDWLGGTSGHWVFNMSAIYDPQQEQTGGSYLSDPCTEPWQGLTCGFLVGGQCCIIEIELAYYGLLGQLPHELGDLIQLEYLYLRENSLFGTIPSSLGHLTQLVYISLNNNFLTGTIPSSLGGLSRLEYLLLNTNLLHGPIPSLLSSLAELQDLYLYSNYFTGAIPSFLGNLTQLQYLYLYSNSLTGPIPSSLGDLTQLGNLWLSSNSLTGAIPSSLGDLVQLQQLYLNENFLSGLIPSSLGNLAQLQYLLLNSNCLTGTIPPSLGELTELEYLLVNNNLLVGAIPSELDNLVQLKFLHLFSNILTGSIPLSLGDLSQLSNLLLYDNSLTGPIPSCVGLLTQLKYLYLNTNLLTGSVPSSLGNLTGLYYLYLYSNSLTGPIPLALGNCPRLQYLYLDDNSLTGSIPSSLGNLTQLQYLYLYSNCLTGSTPSSLSGLSQLSQLYLEYNLLTGALPSFSECVSLTQIYLGYNYFTGSISNQTYVLLTGLIVLGLQANLLTGTLPTIFNKTTVLSQLLLNDNSFSGSLPSSLTQLTSLQVLLLQQNQFTGRPDVAFNTSLQTQLSTVDLSFNLFTGTIPSAVFGLPALNSFAAIQSCFHGSIPGAAICGSPYLEYLLLDGASSGQSCRTYIGISAFDGSTSVAYVPRVGFSEGSIPSCIWAMSTLRVLHLSSNGLTGTIAPTVTFQNDSDINLSHNQLTGTIPTALQSASFARLDLSYNRLKGGFTENISPSVQLISLSNNRLSGYVPSSFAAVTGQVSVMQGNLFNCDSQHPAPPNDAYTSQTFCGSQQFNYSIAISAVLFAVFLSLAAVLYHKILRGIHTPGEVLADGTVSAASVVSGETVVDTKTLHDCQMFSKDFQRFLALYFIIPTQFWRKLLRKFFGWINSTLDRSPRGRASPNKSTIKGVSLIKFAYFMRNGFISVLTGGSTVALLCLCVYPALSVSYSTHTEQYLWVVTSAFLEGTTAAGVVLTFYFLGLAVLLALLATVPTSNAGDITGEDSSAHAQAQAQDTAPSPKWLQRVTLKTRVGEFFFSLCLIGSLILANVGYLYVILYSQQSKAIQILAQLALAVFKVFCNICVIPLDPFQHGEKEKLTFLLRKFAFYAFNNVLAPCLVSVFADSQCLFDLFASTAVIVENFDYSLASKQACVNTSQFNVTDDQLGPALDCYSFSNPTALVSKYYPPFTYSYQCGAAIITNYGPVLFYSYTIQALFAPLLVSFLCLHFLSRDRAGNTNGTAKEPVLSLIGRSMAGVLRPLSTAKTGQQLFASSSHSAIAMQFALVLLTFGVSSPLLGFVMLITVMSYATSTTVQMMFYLELSPRCRQGLGSEENRTTKGLSDGLSVGCETAPKNSLSKLSTLRLTADEGTTSGWRTVSSATLGDVIDGIADPTGGLEEACALSAWSPHSLYWPVALIASSFWGLMVFDMVGNTVVADPTKALWAPVTALLVPLAMGAILFLSLRCKTPLVSCIAHLCLKIPAEDKLSAAAAAAPAAAAGDDFGLEGLEKGHQGHFPTVDAGAVYRVPISATNVPQDNPMLYSVDTSEASVGGRTSPFEIARVERQGSRGITRSLSNIRQESSDRRSANLFPRLSFTTTTAAAAAAAAAATASLGERGAPASKKEKDFLETVHEN